MNQSRKQRGDRGREPQSAFGERMLHSLDGMVQRVVLSPGLARHFLHMAHLLVVGIRRTQLTRMAAALAYRTVFGLIPVLVVGIVVLAAFASDDQVRSRVSQILRYSGLSQIAAPEPVIDAALVPGLNFQQSMWMLQGINGGTAQQTAAASAATSQKVSVDQWIEGVVDKIREVPIRTIGGIGIIILFYAAISMLVEIEKAFNQIYNAPEGRSWARRITQYWTLLTLGTIFLVASFAVQEYVSQYATELSILDEHRTVKSVVLNILSFVLPLCISTMLLLIVYLIVPNTRVLPLPALVGAFTSAVLWETGKLGFTQYLQFSTTYSKMYGAIAILPLFLLWIYVTWLIVLLGLQLAAATQTHRLATAEGLSFSLLATFGFVDDARPVRPVKIVDPASMLVVLNAVAERFTRGQTSDHSDIAQETSLDQQSVSDMLERLAGAGLLLRVLHSEHEGTFTLAKPPNAIAASEVLLLAEDLTVGGRMPANRLMELLVKARIDALAGKTLADLMDRKPEPPPPSAPVEARPPAGVPATTS